MLVGWFVLSIGVAEFRSARALRQSTLVWRMAEPIPVQRVRVLPSPRQHRDLAHLREMAREQASYDSRADDADPFDHASNFA